MVESSPKPILVGASLSLSGRFAVQGRQAHDGLTLWAEHGNKAGGIIVEPGEPRRPIRLVVYDDSGRQADAAANTRRLISEDRVDLLCGPYSSVLALAAAEVAAEQDGTLWNHGGSSDAMVARGWRHVVNLLSPATAYFAPLLDIAVQSAHRPIRRVALVYGARGTFPAAVIGGAEAHARRLGLEVVLQAAYPKEPDPLRALVRQIADLEPDIILGAGVTEADIAFARALRAQAVQAAVVGLVAAGVQAFADALGADADGFYGPSQWEPTLQDRPEIGPTSSAFAAAFRARFGTAPDYPAAQTYAAGLIAGHCIGVARSLDDKAVRATAAALDTSTFYGRFRADPRTGQQIGHQVVAVQLQSGRKVIVWPREVATGSIALR
ncbi:MAG: amino acid ABC transporter substrate-binding protein [Chloroflexi bacterium]|nr:amino acid ABC transporter substrate-binding protein [Chloroflexota bacterium]